jgi:hypothetical protein
VDLSNVVAVAAGGWDNFLASSVALKSDGLARSWGDRTNVLLGVSNLVAVSFGGQLDSLGLTAAGLTVSSKSSWSGQDDVPPGLSNVVSISLGYAHGVALMGDTSIFRGGQAINPHLTAEGFRAEFWTDFGKTYVLESKNTLNDPSWNFIRLTRGTGNSQFIDESITNSARFYRVRRIP